MANNNAPIQRPCSPVRCRRMKRLAMSLLLLLYLSSSIQPWWHSANARAVPRAMRAKPVKEEGASAVAQSLIGSRPPNCDGRCKGCGRMCMAVQVPVTPQQTWSTLPITKSLDYTRGDDISNYKPMTWKCRCGDINFNP